MRAFPAAPSAARRRRRYGLARLSLLALVLYGIAGCSKDTGAISGLAHGAMAKLAVSAHPAAGPTTAFADVAGRPRTLADFRGKVVLLNLWANWCAPCKLEVPSLAKLQAEYAGKPVAVVAVSLGKGDDEAAGRAFIAHNPPLAFYSEPTYALPYAFKPPIADVPTTIVFDRAGRERARLAGGADWSGAQARAVVDALLAGR